MAMTAPYRHIPISAFVHEPSWKDDVSIDRPMENGLSGWLDITLTARTEFLIGGRRVKTPAGTEVHFNKAPSGNYAIPGSTLRGMLRSVLEIAAFGRAAFVDDVRYGVRDLTQGGRAVYGSRLVQNLGNMNGRPATRPKSRAGWLRRRIDNATGLEVWEIQPCRFSRVAVMELNQIQPGIEAVFRPDEGAPDRYGHWRRPLDQSLNCAPERFHSRVWRQQNRQGPYNPSVEIQYSEATIAGEGDRLPGRLVFTGKTASGLHERPADPNQQGRYYGKKKHEFFFHSRVERWIDVTPLKQDFLDVHQERQGRVANESWAFWRNRFGAGEEIPVFFIDNGVAVEVDDVTAVEAFGLAMMFRLAHKQRTMDLVRNASPRHGEGDLRDFPALLFGPELQADNDAFKGRVSCETAIAPTAELAAARTVILATPNGQFFQAMVAQPVDEQGNLRGGNQATYASYTPLDAGLDEVRRPEIAGRKRYPTRGRVVTSNLGQENAEMRSILHPLKAETAFSGRIQFHNLQPEELGALTFALELWVPEWGNRPDLRHRLGMGKPLGLGDARIDIAGARIESNVLTQSGDRDVLEGKSGVDRARQCADAFASHMSKAYDSAKTTSSAASWKASQQIELLLAMSDPLCARDQNLDYMLLAPQDRIDEFRAAKQNRQVIPDYPRRPAVGETPGVLTDRQVFKRPPPPAVAVPARQQNAAGGAAARAAPAAPPPRPVARKVLDPQGNEGQDGGATPGRPGYRDVFYDGDRNDIMSWREAELKWP